jgi:regulator of ribonuclease activity B
MIMNVSKTREAELQVGDLCEVQTPAGLAYLQYTHDAKDSGQLVRVLPGLYTHRPGDLRALVDKAESYFVFFTLEYALRQKEFKIIANLPVPRSVHAIPLMRKAGIPDRSGRVGQWFIGPALTLSTVEGLKNALKVSELTHDQKRLSIETLWPPPVMISKLMEGWLPELEGEFRIRASTQRTQSEDLVATPGEQSVNHYFYFPERSNADAVALRLGSQGWNVEVRKGADRKKWLLLARQPLGENQKDTAELEQLAAQFQGEYDGSGRAV